MKIKQLLCKHEFKTSYNIHGDMINRCDGNRRIEKCMRCGKEELRKELDIDCNRTNQ